MTIKLMLVKSGEDLIADVAEMSIPVNDIEDESERRVVGYYLTKPCVVKMRNPNTIDDVRKNSEKKSGFEVFLYPWIPLSADEKIPIPADWLITMVEPTAKLKEMYVNDVLNYGKEDSKDSISTEQANSDQSD